MYRGFYFLAEFFGITFPGILPGVSLIEKEVQAVDESGCIAC
jgi:hypothetical protein